MKLQAEWTVHDLAVAEDISNVEAWRRIEQWIKDRQVVQMTDPTKVGMAKFRFVAGAKDAPDPNEPEWIKDSNVNSNHLFVIPKEMDQNQVLADLCEGEKHYCELCGQGFPLWPPKYLARHIVDEHAKKLTTGPVDMATVVCQDALTGYHQQLFVSQLAQRVVIRHRAWKMGLFVPAPEIAAPTQPGSPSRIVKPN